MSYNVYDSRGFRGQVASNHGLGLLYDYLEGKGVDDLVDDGSAELDGDFLARLDKVPAPKDKAVASTLARLKELAHECRDVVIISDGVGIDEEAEKALKPDYADALRKRLEGALAADMETALKKAFALLKERVLTEAGVKGGEGSGFPGHAGRPGQVGGSVPAGEGGYAWRGRLDTGDHPPAKPSAELKKAVDTVRQRLAALPQHHLKGLKRVMVDSNWLRQHEMDFGLRQNQVRAFHWGDRATIVIDEAHPEAVEHEVGHHYYLRHQDEVAAINKRAFEAAKARGKSVSRYALSGEYEHWGDWYESYARAQWQTGARGERARQHLAEVDPEMNSLMEQLWREPGHKGGPGSGHFGHAGRPGQVGGGVPDEERRGRMPKFPKLRTRPLVSISANDNQVARDSQARVRERLKDIPNHHLPHIVTVYINSGVVDGIERRNGYTKGRYAGFYTRNTTDDGGYISLRDDAWDSFDHELGHHVWYEYEDKISPISSRVYEGARKRHYGISTYGMKNEKEYFAEWYQAYARMRRRSGSSFGDNDRAHLEKLDPEMFNLMKELWHDK